MVSQNWIESIFCKRECVKFLPSSKDNARCCCGHLWQFHRDGSPAILLRTHEAQELHWSPSRHTQLLPTDAYGTIQFQGGPHPTKAQYIRLAHDTCPSLILELLSREWGLGLPKLLITIQGGKTNFDLQPKLKKVIRKGLLKAAKTTGAWVFTAGTNTGVTRHVGDALAVETTVRDRGGGSVVSVGIVPWGIVERKNELIGRNRDVPYHPITSPKTRYATLNSHHRYFLLVDNGTVGKYGPEIILRRKLENYISQQRIETRGGLVTPVVCVVIEGGPQTIRQVLEYVTDSPPVPVIVCDGTGRAADILAFVHKYAVIGPSVLEENRGTIVKTLERVFELRSEQAEKLFVELLQCAKKKDLITVFRLKEDSELDQAILSALLHLKRLSPPEQLSLALTWNRVDMAGAHVFDENVEWPPDSLEQAMMDALVNDRIEFVKLLLEQGVSMAKFLTTQRLEELYNSKQGPSNTLQFIIRDVKKHIPKDYKFTLLDIGFAMNKLMGGAFRSSYTRKKFRSYYNCLKNSAVTNGALFALNRNIAAPSSTLRAQCSIGMDLRRGSTNNNQQCTFEYPFSELLVWAVLTKRQALALLMWQHGEEAIAKALIAAKLYKALAHEAADDDLEAQVYEELRKYAKEFETLALDVLDYCYKQDEDKAHQLLTYELKNWSKQTCLSLAVVVNHRALLSHPCCQILLADLWLGGLRTRKNTNIKVLMGLVMPPMIALLGFRSKEELRSMPQTSEEHRDEEHYRYSDSESDVGSEEDQLDINDPDTLETGSLFPPISPEVQEDYFNKQGRVRITVPAASSSSGPTLPSLQSYLLPLFNTTYLSNVVGSNEQGGISSRLQRGGFPAIRESRDAFSPSKLDTTIHSDNSKELSMRMKFYEFYNAPITKFWAHSIAFIFFLCTYTYMVLVKLDPMPHYGEWFVFIYMVTLLIEKFREIISSEPVTLKQKLEVWSNKLWNVFDLFFTVCFVIGFSLRMQSGYARIYGRLIYCVDSIYWYLKVLEILSTNKYLGPLVMMMGKMVKNMAYFVILLLVVLMAFGVSRQSILFPNEEPNWNLAKEIFYQPYFMIYGEVFADDIDPDCGEEGEPECVPGRWINITVMSIYLLVANILLINLLIAVFNNIFISVNAISHQVWMFQRFRVVMEFEMKPVFPPPLIFISHLHRGTKYLIRLWRRKPYIYDHGLKLFLVGENLERIHDFEEECVGSYTREKELKVQMSTDEQVHVMTEKQELLLQRTEDLQNKFNGILGSINSVEFLFKQFQEEMQHTKNSYAVIHKFMLRHVRKERNLSGTRSGNITPTSQAGGGVRSFSQTRLCQMLEETQKYMLRHASQDEGENETDTSGGDSDTTETVDTEQETVRSKHGNLTVQMSLSESAKKKSKNSPTKFHKGFKSKKKDGSQRKDTKGRESPRVRRRTTSQRHSDDVFSEDSKPLAGSSKVSFNQHSKEFTETETEAEEEKKPSVSYTQRRPFRRSFSEGPDDDRSPPKYDRSISTGAARPAINVIPPSTPPPIITFTAEYTSIGDELETVMSQFAHQTSPLIPPQHRLRQRFFSDSSPHYEFQIHEYHNVLRDAEEADYYLMESIIQRRMHRDSENLAASLEELCSIVSDDSDTEETKKSKMLSPRTAELRKRHSASSIELHRSDHVTIRDARNPLLLNPRSHTSSGSRSVGASTVSLERRASSVYSGPFPSSVRPSLPLAPHSVHLGVPSNSIDEGFCHFRNTPTNTLQIPSYSETEAMPAWKDPNETSC